MGDVKINPGRHNIGPASPHESHRPAGGNADPPAQATPGIPNQPTDLAAGPPGRGANKLPPGQHPHGAPPGQQKRDQFAALPRASDPHPRIGELHMQGDYKRHATLSHLSQGQSHGPISAGPVSAEVRLGANGVSVEVQTGEHSISVRTTANGSSGEPNADQRALHSTPPGRAAAEAPEEVRSPEHAAANEEARRDRQERTVSTASADAPDDCSFCEPPRRDAKGAERSARIVHEGTTWEKASPRGRHSQGGGIDLGVDYEVSLGSVQTRGREQTSTGRVALPSHQAETANPTLPGQAKTLGSSPLHQAETTDPIERFWVALDGAKETKHVLRGMKALISSLLDEAMPPDQRGRTASSLLRAASDQFAQAVARLTGQDDATGSQISRTDEFAQAVARLTGRREGGTPGLGEAVDRFLQTVQLDKYLQRAGRTRSEVVRQAETSIVRTLYGSSFNSARNPTAQQLEYVQGSVSSLLDRLRPTVAEALRDLRAGLFLPAQEARGPFMLNDRARVVTELMELARALDGIDRLTRALEQLERRITQDVSQMTRPVFAECDGEAHSRLAPSLAPELDGLAPETKAKLESLLFSLSQALPSRAGRSGMFHLIIATEGMLVDPQGNFLALRETGTPLKLDQLLLFATTQGSVENLSEKTSSRSTPLLLYGLDALYSMIGFDGRTLAAPHFAAVHASIEGSGPEWAFGHEELSEGWLRAVIERLKDAANVQHNALGETLEEALADGRFHLILINGSPAEGWYHVGAFFPGAQARVAA